ncbi:hypothetical protein CHUAL_011885 [Chamberlinius hualienensis]
MEYWECISRGGQPISYCGPSENQVCCIISKNAKPIGILPRPSSVTQCGRKGITSNASKGEVADVAEWPWHAAILEAAHKVYVCGATLIDERWLLTAAHCVYTYLNLPPSLDVRLGEHDVTHTNERYQYEEVAVERVILHPDFVNTTLLNDVALLKLSNKLKKRPNIDIVCIGSEASPETQQTSGSPRRCTTIGWGRTSETSSHSSVLKEINVPLWTNSDCQNVMKSQFGSTFVLPHTAICAGTEDKDACDGDGGGPLMCELNGRWEQVGIVSYGVGCGRPNLPGVYTRVAAFSTWIKQTIRKYS